MFKYYSHMNYESAESILWIRQKYINYIIIFILFYGLGYIFDIIFLSISLLTIIALLFLKNTSLDRYIINQPLILWLAVLVPYTLTFSYSDHYDIFFPFGWIFTSDFGYRGYGISQMLQSQGQELFIISFVILYIAGNLEVKYDKWSRKHNCLIKKLKKDYICTELHKKLPNKENAFHYLVYQGNINKIKELFQNRILKEKYIDDKDTYGRYPIHLIRDIEILSFFIEQGTEIDEENIYNGQTLFHLSAHRGDLKLAKFLTEKGANINKKDIRGRTPLDYVNSDEMRKFLITKGGKETILHKRIKHFFLKKMKLVKNSGNDLS